MSNQTVDVLILGGGAAGLFCAFTAAKRGLRVRVLEGSNKPGKKILMSGGGRCNFTNLDIQPDNYLSSNPHFVKSALSSYTQWDFIQLVEQHGIAYHEKTLGQLFCDESSKAILALLLAECADTNVTIDTRVDIQSIEALEPGFRVTTNQGDFVSRALVVATGGLSIPTTGASGLGYQIAEQFNLSVLPRSAGLVPFTFSEPMKEVCIRLAGLSLDAELSTADVCFREGVLFTHRGLSGPAALQISSYWVPGTEIWLNLLPSIDVKPWLIDAKRHQAKTLLRTVLASKLPKALVAELEALFWPAWAQTLIAEIPDATLSEIAMQLSSWPLRPAGTEGYRTAEVTLQGIDTRHLSSKTMECREHPDLYFIGEVVDVTGHLGGYNFQWAWSSGYAAGMHVLADD